MDGKDGAAPTGGTREDDGDRTVVSTASAVPVIEAPAPTPGGSALAPGVLLGHTYRIEALLARGGMGEVYRARHEELGSLHAIKVILASLGEDARIINMFTEEAKKLRRVRDDAVVGYEGLFRDEFGRRYLVMELVDGPSLSDIMKDRKLTLSEVGILRERMARGLGAAHEKGIFHRDISPDNIIFPGGRVENAKIIDFGIAKSADPSDKTVIGDEFAGKYSYVSPEQLGMYGGKVDGRSDIYSLGLVLIAGLLGRKLKMGSSMLQAIEARRGLPDLAEVPPPLRDEVARMLQPDPNDRPAQIRDILGDSEPTQLRPADRAGAVPNAAAARRGGMIGAAALAAAVVVVGGGLYAVMGNGSHTRTTDASGGTTSQGNPSLGNPSQGQTADPAATGQTDRGQANTGQANTGQSAQSSQGGPTTQTGSTAQTGPATQTQAGQTRPASQSGPQAGSAIAPTQLQRAQDAQVTKPPAAATAVQPPAAQTASPPTGTTVAGTTVPPAGVAATTTRPPLQTATVAPPPVGQTALGNTAATAGPPAAAVLPPDRPVQEAAISPPSTQALAPPKPSPAAIRGSLQQIFGGYSCARLSDQVGADLSGSVNGFVSSEADAARLRAELASLSDAHLATDIAVHGPPHCDLLLTLAADTREQGPAVPTLQLDRPNTVYKAGQTLNVKAVMNRPGLLYVDYVDGAGEVVHLLPNPVERQNRLAAGQQVSLGKPKGSTGPDDRVYEMGPPYGPNMIIAIVTDAPLFPQERPEVEEAKNYLPDLQERLRALAAKGSQAASTWRFFDSAP